MLFIYFALVPVSQEGGETKSPFAPISRLLAQKSKQKANSLSGGKPVVFVIEKCHL